MISLRSSALFLKPLIPTISRYEQAREIKRWSAPVLREFNKRKRKMGPEPLRPRSSFLDWNYNAELFAFNKRLNENIEPTKLQQAFIHQSFLLQEEKKQKELGVEAPKIELVDNRELIVDGERLIYVYTEGFVKYSLPKLPATLIAAILRDLTSDTSLAKIALNLGMGDLVLCADFPAQEGTLADTFKAIIGSIASSSGEQKAYTFIRDFICTQLNQRDLSEICRIENPFEELKLYCKTKNIAEPEVRLIGESAKNTVLAAYNVGIYSDQKLIGRGFGENVATAVDVAAYNALREFWGFPEHMKPFNFEIKIEKSAQRKLESKN